jgi:hypothetical protein
MPNLEGVRLPRPWIAVAVAIALTALAAAAGPAQAASPRIVAAGDIACDELPTEPTTCQQQATANLISSLNPTAVLAMGDTQYEDGAADLFQRYYAQSWGRFKSITHPAIGNHEYRTPGGLGYFGYFGAAAGPQGLGYYSFDLGNWHLVALNSNCKQAGGCQRGSPQERWLASDLAAHPKACTLAYWHQPHFSSGPAGDDDGGTNPTGAFWTDLYNAGAELVLGGHDHDYERFAPQKPNADADAAFGIRQFVAGTGGRSIVNARDPSFNTQVWNASTFGVLQLTLSAHSYRWRFVPVPGGTFSDTGTGACHDPPSYPLVKLSGPRHRLSRTGALRLRARCAAACSTRARIVIRTRRHTIRSRLTTRVFTPQKRHQLRIKFSRRGMRAVRQAFLTHKRLPARVYATATPEGTTKTLTASIKVRLKR